MGIRPVGLLQLFDRVEGKVVYFRTLFLFHTKPEAAFEYEQFFVTPHCVQKWSDRSADQIADLFENAALVIHRVQEGHRQADLTMMQKWGWLGRWVLKCARWQPRIVQTMPEITKEMSRRCYDIADTLGSQDHTPLAHKARTVGAKIKQV